jgi:hypothetical protein
MRELVGMADSNGKSLSLSAENMLGCTNDRTAVWCTQFAVIKKTVLLQWQGTIQFCRQ